MIELLNNPVYHALVSGDRQLGFGTEKAKAFDEEVSPFAGFEEDYSGGFSDLHDMLPPERRILYATPLNIDEPAGWKFLEKVDGVQMLYSGSSVVQSSSIKLLPLNAEHIPEMVALAHLTKPGPFGSRTIEFGNYYGVFEKGKLAAMAGQRMHIHEFTEISAVCTHPDYLGKGYAAALVQQQINHILDEYKTPFLHVRGDNQRAIDLYKRLGFEIRSVMRFYFLGKQGKQGKQDSQNLQDFQDSQD